MLTADHVAVRRSKGDLKLVALDDDKRARLATFASFYLGIAGEHVGRTRDEFESACARLVVPPVDRKLAAGVKKLVVDRVAFESDPEIDPSVVRREIFVAASRARREAVLHRFDRAAVLAEVAGARGLDPEALERLLYADLKGAQKILAVTPASPSDVAAAYELGRVQAVLLRAVRVKVRVSAASPVVTRGLFRSLKFHRLLFRIERDASGDDYVVDIDGPFSMFEAVTKYGLNLALAFPSIAACDGFSLEADVRWGKERTPLSFRVDHRAVARSGAIPASRALPDEVAELAERIRTGDSGWDVAPATRVLDLPGVGLVVPDLECTREGRRVYVEVLGYWSRDAVWKRVELVEKGLGEPVVFAFSKRLRVDEDVLDEDLPAALYAYKGTMNARTLTSKLDAVAGKVAARSTKLST
ncbi:MAG: DUF790 family protein [Polyangiaceae bacterium]